MKKNDKDKLFLGGINVKKLVKFFCVMLALVTVFAFAGCEHTHSWVNGVCTECNEVCIHEGHEKDAKCTACGLTVAHSWQRGKCTICKLKCSHEKHDRSTLVCDTCGDEVNHNYIYEDYLNGTCTMCGDTTSHLLSLVDPDFKVECAKKGTVSEVIYSTRAYAIEALQEDETIIKIQKKMYVYLPYGYSPEKKYDVLYLMHGGGDNEGYWFGTGDYKPDDRTFGEDGNKTATILDNMIEKKMINPLIVVTPTFYSYADGYSADKADFTANFGKELKNDIMPYIATHYATYATGSTPADLIAARDHQAYAGLSMGSMTGFSSVLMYCTDYISWVGNFSGCKADLDAISASLNGEYANYKINYWFNANGKNDAARVEHKAAYAEMLKKCPDKFTEGENCIFIDKAIGAHAFYSWEIDLFNLLTIFFK